MSKAAITIGTAPKVPKATQAAQVAAFVSAPPREVNPSFEQGRVPMEEKEQRLAVEIPISLHTFMKMECTAKRLKMRDEVYKILLAHYKELGYVPPAQ